MALGDWPDVAARMTMPAILGHEAAGRIVAIGAGVTGFTVGQRVGVGWLHSVCGQCEFCRSDAENICLERTVTGIAAPGGFAEFMRIRASHAIPIPETIPPEQAAPFFCAGLTVYHACRNAGIRAGQPFGGAQGKRVAVIGIGGLGHLAVQLARDAGAEVVAADVSEPKLELARRLGAAETVDARSPDAAKLLKKGGKPHVVIVAAGSKAAYDLAFRILRRRGTLAVVGLPKEDVTFNADNFVVGEYHIVGSAVGTRQETRELLELVAAGRLHCEVETQPLEAINDIFARMQGGNILGRAVIQFP
jgi:propanol-preferring alcohol dehydrogenase